MKTFHLPLPVMPSKKAGRSSEPASSTKFYYIQLPAPCPMLFNYNKLRALAQNDAKQITTNYITTSSHQKILSSTYLTISFSFAYRFPFTSITTIYTPGDKSCVGRVISFWPFAS